MNASLKQGGIPALLKETVIGPLWKKTNVDPEDINNYRPVANIPFLGMCSMPSCITAFHVTCAFEHNLDMRTLLAENDEVKFKSFCLEHSSGATKPPDEARVDADQGKLDMEKVTLRKQKLQQLEEDFYDLVKPSEVAENLDLTEWLVDFVYQYWKMKRKANYNKPLMIPKTDEVDNLAQQEQDVLYRRLKLFTHLRQDLERVS
ncbi:E3 ubiquitin-protein ligase Jade-2 [Varanus komodoensis]|nr:E3 ubiquitin-protein ligase Jade-2 [Varanus komodoensis]